MPHLFTNNAATKLLSEIGEDDTTLMVLDGGVFASPDPGGDDDRQMLTLSHEGDVEIVKLQSRDGNTLTVVRGQEGTGASAWPGGSDISARITAGMLGSFVQDGASKNDGVAIGSGSVAMANRAIAIGKTRNSARDTWVIHGAPIIPKDYNLFEYGAVGNAGAEAVCTSPLVDLGVPPTWSQTYYADGDIIIPTTPNGCQYRAVVFKRDSNNIPWDAGVLSLTEPTWQTSPESLTPSDSDEGEGLLAFLCMQPTDGFYLESLTDGTTFFPHEVGFICTKKGASATAPTVKISAGHYAGDLATSETMTAVGSGVEAPAIWRFPTANRVGRMDAFFCKLLTASNGSYVGRFYAKGMLVAL